MEKIKKYTKKSNYSYVIGAFPSIELINKRPDLVKLVLIDPKYYEKDDLISILERKQIAYKLDSKLINRLSNKDNTLVLTLFDKFDNLILNNNHLVLDNISDMGNLGTIIRTMNGFGVNDLALIGNSCDIFNPKVIRASMGSIFNIRFQYFDTMESYLERYKDRSIKLFMLSKDLNDSIYNMKKIDENKLYSLVFGNESSGLPEYYEKYGNKVFIPQTEDVDSFNLTIAVGIALFEMGR